MGLDDAGAGWRGRRSDCGWSEAQKRAYVLADKQLAITGSGWDPELLRLELGELQLSGFDLSLTGFGDLELKDIMADRTAGLTDQQYPTGRFQPLRDHRVPAGDMAIAPLGQVSRRLDGS